MATMAVIRPRMYLGARFFILLLMASVGVQARSIVGSFFLPPCRGCFCVAWGRLSGSRVGLGLGVGQSLIVAVFLGWDWEIRDWDCDREGFWGWRIYWIFWVFSY